MTQKHRQLRICAKNTHNYANYINGIRINTVVLYLAAQIKTIMTSVLLNAFYDIVQYGLGMTMCYIFMILMTIELIYVMVKYLGGNKK